MVTSYCHGIMSCQQEVKAGRYLIQCMHTHAIMAVRRSRLPTCSPQVKLRSCCVQRRHTYAMECVMDGNGAWRAAWVQVWNLHGGRKAFPHCAVFLANCDVLLQPIALACHTSKPSASPAIFAPMPPSTKTGCESSEVSCGQLRRL